MKTTTPQQHTYGFIYKTSEIGMEIFSLLCIAVGLFLLYVFINSADMSNRIDNDSILIFLAYFLAFFIWSPIVFTFLAYMFPDIEVQNDGIKIHYLFRKRHITWEEVIEIKPFRPFGLFTNKNAKVMVVRNNLTFIHRLYGLVYTGENKPAVLIFRQISDYDVLIRNISKRAKLNQ